MAAKSTSSPDPKPTETKTQAKPQPKATTATYADTAASLAEDARALAERTRTDMQDLADRCTGIDVAPEPADAAAANGVHRIPMSTADVNRALDGLVSVAADLARDSAR